jgi:hypothetical protein
MQYGVEKKKKNTIRQKKKSGERSGGVILKRLTSNRPEGGRGVSHVGI